MQLVFRANTVHRLARVAAGLKPSASSSSFGNRIRRNGRIKPDHALAVQRSRGDQAVELWLGAEMEQEANREVRRSEVVVELAGRERRQRRRSPNALVLPQSALRVSVPYRNIARLVEIPIILTLPTRSSQRTRQQVRVWPIRCIRPFRKNPSSRLRRILLNETFASVHKFSFGSPRRAEHSALRVRR